MEKILFDDISKSELFNFIKENEERKIFNFLNADCVYQAKKEKLFFDSVCDKNCINCIDGALVSMKLSFFAKRKIPRIRGPTFTKDIISNPESSENIKHFFIGYVEKDIILLKKKYQHLKNISYFNPSYVKGIIFPEKEISEIAKKINKEKPDYVWVGVGGSKQSILSSELFKRTNAKYFFNVGAAFDFILDKKKEAPSFVRKLAMEWAYRLITDFKYSKNKVLRSFIAIRYLNSIELKK